MPSCVAGEARQSPESTAVMVIVLPRQVADGPHGPWKAGANGVPWF